MNLTSIHGLYRDRLASAFLVGEDTGGTVAIEEDLDLAEICCHEAGSTAPYHIVNTALNLQGSKLPEVQDRQSDFFVFTKKFIGGKTTGYCRSETMERVFPQMDLPTAMAISAAAASPNMGRGTNPALVAIMTLLNVRLGFWIPNPGRIESWLDKRVKDPPERQGKNSGYSFNEVFREELNEIERRWEQLPARGQRCLASINGNSNSETRLAHGLVGVAYSGGGIRSATLNLGVTQALHQSGVFDHADYMSTVSGGGYLGSSISTLMRQKTTITSDVAGIVGVHESKSETMVSISEGRAYRFRGDARLRVIEGETVRAGQRLIRRSFSPMALVRGLFALYINPVGALWRYWKYKTSSEIDGTVSIKKSGSETVVSVSKPNNLLRTYFYASHAQLAVEDGDAVKVGQRLIRIGRPVNSNRSTLVQAYGWRVRPAALLREIRGKLDEKWRWVNVSDGGHIENLATIELLRRRCKYIIIGDGEADPKHHFNGLATLIRSARIDLGIHIEINLDCLRLDKDGYSQQHWAIGRIKYPGDSEYGYLLYLKSSVTGDEDEVIKEYRNASAEFPHESTADQFFGEGQFEAYRSLGQHIAEEVLREGGWCDYTANKLIRDSELSAQSTPAAQNDKMSYEDLGIWFKALAKLKSPGSTATHA